ncbi:hypothetical protein FLACOL7796_04744 [Flavobacterium collinsii]|uniref:Uncharacterized protein n=1 Tax=Flavobacterium collinsii TaxID=1114861 RepID=A0A9W4TK68_9FLAO|nr:hypothetical protein FLACOL7796_04744 [Flavobacterium collinsii]CAI2768802.1 conserved membrane protein of unknown function [Flavobacterium collinsii]
MKLEIVLLLSMIVIMALIFFVFIKFKLYGAINYIVGSILIVILCKIDLSGGFHSKEEVIIYFGELICFTILYCSSYLRSFFSADYKRKYYFLFPVMFYLLILLFISLIESNSVFLFKVAKNLFLAYFPLSLLLFYKRNRYDK